jgi:hypothetical protein
MTDELNPDVRALLDAVHAALDVPLPGLEDRDERAYVRILAARASAVKYAAAGVGSGMTVGTAAAYIEACIAANPCTYGVWTPKDES